MRLRSKLVNYLNPITHFGERKYSFFFPFFVNFLICFLSEWYALEIAKNPNSVGAYIIFVNVALIIYFSFRDGIRGGIVSSLFSVGYYFYVIQSRNYKGNQFTTAIETTIILGLLYIILASVIGWLRQKIDTLIEREANEKKRLRTIIQQLPVGVLITDSKGRVVQANKQVDAILGVKIPLGFMSGKDPALVSGEQDGKPVALIQSPLARTIATGKPVVGKEFMITRKDGKQVYVQLSATAIHNKKGKIIAAAEIINDITQQKELEARKDDFVNMASHELKTPVTSMKLYIDSLMKRVKEYDDERALKILMGIKNQTNRLQELVNDLLDVSRLQTGKLSLTKEQFRIDSLIIETIDGLQEAAGNRTIKFLGKRAMTVSADRFRISQVLTNLLTNAIKYSPESKDIIVRLNRDGSNVVVSVQDDGMGIAKEQQKKIFEKLYQVTDSKGKTFPGLGMGLYISKEIVKRHSGQIWVESEKGKGSTFYVSLPSEKK